MNRQIDTIEVKLHDPDSGMLDHLMFDHSQKESAADEFMRWLVTEGFYDDIQATKRFSVSTEVMKRLKGKS